MKRTFFLFILLIGMTGFAHSESSTSSTSIPARTLRKATSPKHLPTDSPTETKATACATLDITKVSSGGPFTAGTTISYTVTVTNTSPTDPVTNIVVQDVLPANIVLGQVFLSANWSLSGNTLISSTFDLAPGDFEQFTVTSQIIPNIDCGELTNCASVISATGACSLPTACVDDNIYGPFPPPIPGPNADFCFGQFMGPISATAQFGGQLLWYHGVIASGTPPIGTGANLIPPFTAVGTYDYLVVELVNGCPTPPSTVTVTIHPQPTITINPAGPFCELDPVTPISVTTSVAGTGTWSGPINANGQFDPSAAGVGTHTVTYSFTDIFGCNNQESIVLTVLAAPPPVSVSPATACTDGTPFQLISVPATGGVWSGQHVSPTGLFTPPATPGIYPVTYTITVGQTCVSTSTANVTVTDAEWAQTAGNQPSSTETGEDVQVDSDGNVYMTGTCGIGASFGSGGNIVTINGPGFLAKYNECGELEWAISLPRPGKSLVIDNSEDNVLVTGGGDSFGFLSSYQSSGTLNWVETMTSMFPFGTVGMSIDMDDQDIVYITGYFTHDTDFNGLGGIQLVGTGIQDGFIASYDPNTMSWLGIQHLQTTATVTPRGISVDEVGNTVYIGGSYDSDVDLGGGLALSGSDDFISQHERPFVTVLNGTNVSGAVTPLSDVDWSDPTEELFITGGNTVESYSSALGQIWTTSGPASETYYAIHYDPLNEALYVAGKRGGNSRAIARRADNNGGGFFWGIGSSNNQLGPDQANGIATSGLQDANGNLRVFFTGSFEVDIEFPGSTFHSANGIGEPDIFLARIKDNGSGGQFFRETNVGNQADLPSNAMDSQEPSAVDGKEDSDSVVGPIQVYPNPFSTSIFLDLSAFPTQHHFALKLLDVNGKTIEHQFIDGGTLREINLEQLPSGVYLIRLQQEERVITKRVIKR